MDLTELFELNKSSNKLRELKARKLDYFMTIVHSHLLILVC